MNIALLLQQQLVAAVGRFMRGTATRHQQASYPAIAQRGTCQDAPYFVADDAFSARANATKVAHPLVKPLRVVRLLEAGQASASVGRMVISGRMADVCAELDRLAATEVALG